MSGNRFTTSHHPVFMGSPNKSGYDEKGRAYPQCFLTGPPGGVGATGLATTGAAAAAGCGTAAGAAWIGAAACIGGPPATGPAAWIGGPAWLGPAAR
jgi:hypothetical protein